MEREDATINNAMTMRPGSGETLVLGRIDQYELLRELGGGGFGTVYLAKDTVSGVEVAVKGLPPFVKNNREEMENIRANFALVSRLHHPNIAAALVLHPAQNASYVSEDVRQKLRILSGDALMVMEYASGVTLSQWRRQFPESKVPIDQALEIARQIASALDYAHERKIVHRDIKPANVMIETADDGSVTARVLDFGLAAEIRSSMGRVSREIHDTSGTRPYMAPEQWLGGRQGPATDQYALAVLFCELVTGEVPFSSVFDTGDPVVMMNVVGREQFAPPPELAKPIRLALAGALAKNPESRFATCGGFVAALEGKKVSRGGAETRNGGVGKALAVLVSLAALAGVGYYCWTKYNAEVKAREAEAARIAAEQKAAQERMAAEQKAEAARIAAEKAAEVARIRQEVYELKGKASQASERSKNEEWHGWPHFGDRARALDGAFRAGEAAFAKDDYAAARVQYLKVCDMWHCLNSNKIERAKAMAAHDNATSAKQDADSADTAAWNANAYANATNILSGAFQMLDSGDFVGAAAAFGDAVSALNDAATSARVKKAEKAKAERKAAEIALRKAKEEAERIAREKAEADRLARDKAEKARIEKERMEAERQTKAEAERKEKEAKEKAEAERIERENAIRLAAERKRREAETALNRRKMAVTQAALEAFRRGGSSQNGLAMDILEEEHVLTGELCYYLGKMYKKDFRYAGLLKDEEKADGYFRKALEMGFDKAREEIHYGWSAAEQEAWESVKSGDVDRIKKTINRRSRFLGLKLGDSTLMHMAAKYANGEILEYLSTLGYGFAHDGSADEERFLRFACSNTNATRAISCLKWFKSRGADLKIKLKYAHSGHLTCDVACLETFKFLENEGVPVFFENSGEYGGYTVLHKLVYVENVEPELIDNVIKYMNEKASAKHFWESGSIKRADSADNTGRTPFHNLMENPRNAVRLIDVFVNNGFDINARMPHENDDYGTSAYCDGVLQYACERCNWRVEPEAYRIMIKKLIANGAGINCKTAGRDVTWAPLYVAVKDANHIAVEELLAAGADPNYVSTLDKWPGFSLLTCAIGSDSYPGQDKIVELLLSHGANPNMYSTARHHEGQSAIHFAAEAKRCNRVHEVDRIFRALLKHGADIEDQGKPKSEKEGMTPLLVAASEKNFAAVRTLVDLGCDVNASAQSKHYKGYRALHFAARGYSETEDADAARIIRCLAAHGADVNDRVGGENEYEHGWTPLMCACKEYAGSHRLRIKALLDCGADVNASTEGLRLSIDVKHVLKGLGLLPQNVKDDGKGSNYQRPSATTNANRRRVWKPGRYENGTWISGRYELE